MVEFNVSRKGDTNMPTRDSEKNWKKENTLNFTLRFQNTTDADVIEEIKKHESRNGFIKQCIREYIANHKKDGE